VPARDGLSRRLTLFCAVACGATIANVYYVQPLLPVISDAFQVSKTASELLVTVTQLAFVGGLFFLVPLGDRSDPRVLVPRVLLLAALGSALAAAAPTFWALALGLAIACFSSVAVQIIVSFVSTLAPQKERGRAVAKVMSGALLGILSARTFAGLVASVAGWRAPFVVGSVLMAFFALALRRSLPSRAAREYVGYGVLLRSVAALVRSTPVLRHRMTYGALSFASFNLVWTTLAFLLARSPYFYGPRTIGLFGLAGLGGMGLAVGFGRLADRGHVRVSTGVVLAIVLAGWIVLGLDPGSALAVVFGLVILDVGVQGQNLLSQSVIYGLGPTTAGRVTTAYSTANFLGGAFGSAAGATAWTLGAWHAVCGVGVLFAGLALLRWRLDRVFGSNPEPAATRA
jgi:predicted MFS family arabinose efflux permease